MPDLTGEEIFLLILFFAIFILPIIITAVNLYFKSKRQKTKYDWETLIKVIIAVVFILLAFFGTSSQSNKQV